MKTFLKVKNLKLPAGFDLMTYKFALKPLTHRAILFINNLEKRLFKRLHLIYSLFRQIVRNNMEVSHTPLKKFEKKYNKQLLSIQKIITVEALIFFDSSTNLLAV